MKNNASKQLLLWSLFKVDGSEYFAEIVDAAIRVAYEDSTRQGAFNTIKKKGYSSQTKEDAIGTLFVSVNGIDHKDFELWHEDTCRMLVDNVFKDVRSYGGDSEPVFSFGNAQKFVNMTLKYLYIIESLDRPVRNEEYDYSKWYLDRIAPIESQLHIPIDNYVLQFLYEDRRNNNSSWGELEGIRVKRKTNELYTILMDGEEFCWSKIPEYDSYNRLQKSIIEYYMPKNQIEWENDKWLKIAKTRNDQ